jgi:hypothetical protein
MFCITKSLSSVHSDNTRSFLFVFQHSRCILIEFAIVFNTMSSLLLLLQQCVCYTVFRFSVQLFDELIPAMNRQRNCVCLYCLLTVLGRTSSTVVMDLLMQLVVNYYHGSAFKSIVMLYPTLYTRMLSNISANSAAFWQKAVISFVFKGFHHRYHRILELLINFFIYLCYIFLNEAVFCLTSTVMYSIDLFLSQSSFLATIVMSWQIPQTLSLI